MIPLLLVLAANLAATPPRAPSLTLTPASIVGGNNVSGTIDLGAASAGAVTITLTTSAPGVASFVSPNLGPSSAVSTLQVTVPAGQARASFQVRTFGVAAAALATITASVGGESAAGTLTVNPASLQSITVSPLSIVGGGSATATITLNGATPTPGGLTVRLSLDEQYIAFSGAPPRPPPVAAVPASVSIRPDARNATFTITTMPTGEDRSWTIRTSMGDVANGFTVVAPSLTAVHVTPNRVVGGATVAGSVSLNGAAPPGGFAIDLSADNASVTVPAGVTVPSGATSTAFSAVTRAVVRAATVTITAAHDGSPPTTATSSSGTVSLTPPRITRTAALSVLPLAVASIQIAGASATSVGVFGGRPVDATIILNGTAPAGGTAVTLGSSNAQALSLPATVTVPAGTDRVSIRVAPAAASQVTTASVSASVQAELQLPSPRTAAASPEATTALTIFPLPQIRGITVTPATVRGGTEVAVALDVATATGTFSVRPPSATAQITVSRPDLLQLPATVSVPGAQVQPQPIPLRGTTRPPTADTRVDIVVVLEGSRVSTTVTVQR